MNTDGIYIYTLNNDWIFSREQGEKKPNPWRGMRVSLPPISSDSTSCSQFIIVRQQFVTAELHSFVLLWINKNNVCFISICTITKISTAKLVLSSKITSDLTYMTRSGKFESLQQIIHVTESITENKELRYIHNLYNELIINVVALLYIDLNNDLVKNKIACFSYTCVHIYNYDLILIISKWNW